MPKVVVLAGGTGGAKLASGFSQVDGVDLTVIANTGDDVWIYGARVCPDPDLITFHLADRIDARGWGLDGDTFAAMEQLGELGADNWFRLGDRDLAVGLDRASRLRDGESLTDAISALCAAFGVSAEVIPMCDEEVATHITVAGVRMPFQEFMIIHGAPGPIESIEFEGIENSAPTDAVRNALRTADLIVVGPSNPAISIGPILAVPGMRAAITKAAAPVVGVSPLVNGHAVKGPTEEFLKAAGVDLSALGIATHYGDLLDGFVADGPCGEIPTLVTELLMSDRADQRRLAAETLEFGLSLTTTGG